MAAYLLFFALFNVTEPLRRQPFVIKDITVERMPTDSVKNQDDRPSDSQPSGKSPAVGSLITRSAFGGVLMGLANLVPGISGGTMLLAAGIYERFIDAVAEVTRFRFNFRSLLVLGCVVFAAVLSILLFAGTLKGLVVTQRWVMYSLFIGLTLGGVPLVWKLARPASPQLIVSGLLAFAAMVGLAMAQAYGIVGSGGSSFVMFFGAGLAGASAMILPGLSGGYLLLLMGQYVPILSAIDTFKDALKAKDIQAAMGPAISVILPVGIGVVVGVAVVGNLLQWLLRRYRKATLGLLLGLLIGSVAGLWPFVVGVAPVEGQTVIKGQLVTAENVEDFDEEDWNTEYFRPTPVQVGSSILIALLGFAITMGVSKFGGDEDQPAT